MRYTGHLDLHTILERTFRRAALPLAYTQGFHPQPRIQLAGALPLGFTAEGELADVWLEVDLPPEQMLTALRAASPPGLKLHDATVIDEREPPLQVQLRSAVYRVQLVGAPEGMAERVAALLDQPTLPRVRRDRPYDLRPLIEHLALEAGDPAWLALQLAAREGATGRPEEVVDALGLDPLAARYHRIRLVLRDPDTRA
jgi:radical SAM-linked protein